MNERLINALKDLATTLSRLEGEAQTIKGRLLEQHPRDGDFGGFRITTVPPVNVRAHRRAGYRRLYLVR